MAVVTLEGNWFSPGVLVNSYDSSACLQGRILISAFNYPASSKFNFPNEDLSGPRRGACKQWYRTQYPSHRMQQESVWKKKERIFHGVVDGSRKLPLIIVHQPTEAEEPSHSMTWHSRAGMLYEPPSAAAPSTCVLTPFKQDPLRRPLLLFTFDMFLTFLWRESVLVVW